MPAIKNVRADGSNIEFFMDDGYTVIHKYESWFVQCNCRTTPCVHIDYLYRLLAKVPRGSLENLLSVKSIGGIPPLTDRQYDDMRGAVARAYNTANNVLNINISVSENGTTISKQINETLQKAVLENLRQETDAIYKNLTESTKPLALTDAPAIYNKDDFTFDDDVFRVVARYGWGMVNRTVPVVTSTGAETPVDGNIVKSRRQIEPEPEEPKEPPKPPTRFGDLEI